MPELFNDLRDFLRHTEGQGDLKRVEGADWQTEIGLITEWQAMSEESPALLFDDRIEIPGPGAAVMVARVDQEPHPQVRRRAVVQRG